MRFFTLCIRFLRGSSAISEVLPRFFQHVHFNSRTKICDSHNFHSIDPIDVLLQQMSHMNHSLSIPRGLRPCFHGGKVRDFFGTHKDLAYIPCYETAVVMF